MSPQERVRAGCPSIGDAEAAQKQERNGRKLAWATFDAHNHNGSKLHQQVPDWANMVEGCTAAVHHMKLSGGKIISFDMRDSNEDATGVEFNIRLLNTRGLDGVTSATDVPNQASILHTLVAGNGHIPGRTSKVKLDKKVANFADLLINTTGNKGMTDLLNGGTFPLTDIHRVLVFLAAAVDVRRTNKKREQDNEGTKNPSEVARNKKQASRRAAIRAADQAEIEAMRAAAAEDDGADGVLNAAAAVENERNKNLVLTNLGKTRATFANYIESNKAGCPQGPRSKNFTAPGDDTSRRLKRVGDFIELAPNHTEHVRKFKTSQCIENGGMHPLCKSYNLNTGEAQ
jgi:hypothetical protein